MPSLDLNCSIELPIAICHSSHCPATPIRYAELKLKSMPIPILTCGVELPIATSLPSRRCAIIAAHLTFADVMRLGRAATSPPGPASEARLEGARKLLGREGPAGGQVDGGRQGGGGGVVEGNRVAEGLIPLLPCNTFG